jgi:hypothetical protein
LRKEAEKRVEEEHCEREHQEAEEATKKQAAHVAREQLMDVVVPGVDKMCKEKQRAEAEMGAEQKWPGPCNRCQMKGLECVPYEGYVQMSGCLGLLTAFPGKEPCHARLATSRRQSASLASDL